MRFRRPRRPSKDGSHPGFRKGFLVGCLLGSCLSLVAFALLPLVAFVIAAMGVAFLVTRRVVAELNTPRPDPAQLTT